MMNIVFLDGYTLNPGDLSWEPLQNLGHFTVYDRSTAAQALERAADADVVLVNKQILDEAFFAGMSGLKLVGVTATGYNNVDIEAARRNGVTVVNVRGYSTRSVAQHTFALMLALVSRAEMHSNLVRDGEWSRSPDWCFWSTPLTELAGKTLGLIGYGDIGSEVAKIGKAFGMEIVVHRKSDKAEEGIRLVELDELLKVSDVISLHCPLTDETRGIINEESLSKMKASAFLINTGRGPLIDEAALAQFLEERKLAGAGLDVLISEPPGADNPLLTAPNCIITPHVAWATLEARKRLMELTVRNIVAFESGNPVNKVS